MPANGSQANTGRRFTTATKKQRRSNGPSLLEIICPQADPDPYCTCPHPPSPKTSTASTHPGAPTCPPTLSHTWSCPDCEQIHYFRAVTIKDNTLIRYNHPQDPDDPTQFKTDCQTCLHMQENDPPTLTRALDRTRTDPLHAEAMISVDEFTKTDLVIAVLACPQCTETSLFNTNWKGELTAFWSFGMGPAAESLHQRLHRIQAPDGRQPRLQLLRKAQEQRSRGDRRGRRIHQRELPRHQRRSPDPLALHQPADPNARRTAATFAAGQ